MGRGLVIGGVHGTFAGGEHNDETGMSFNMEFLRRNTVRMKNWRLENVRNGGL